MKLWLIMSIFVLSMAFSLEAQEVIATSVERSKYVFSNGDMLHDKPLIQTDVFTRFKSGLWVDLWTSIPTDVHNIGKDYATELYPTAGWAGKVGEFKVSLGLGYDDLHRTGTFEKTDFLVVIGEVSRDFRISQSLTLSPFLHVETNFTFDGSVTGDTLPRLGTYYSWNITDKVSLDGKAYVLYDPGILFNQTALIGSVDAALHWRLDNHWMLEFPYVRFVKPLTSVSDGRKEQFIWGAGLSFKF